MSLKLGKLLNPVHDRRTLQFENYYDLQKLPPLPDNLDLFQKAGPLPMDGNDQWGDCVVAGAAHMVQVWTGNAGRKPQIIPEKTVVDTYLKLTGGEDTGLYLLEFLKYWKATGFGGHKIGAYMAVNPKNLIAMKYANFLFGGVYLGFALPLTAQDQTGPGKVWDYVINTGRGAPGSWGGHCVNLGAFAQKNRWIVGTWGDEQDATDDFIINYCDEAWAAVALEWFGTDHKTPQGLAWRDLLADLSLVSRLP